MPFSTLLATTTKKKKILTPPAPHTSLSPPQEFEARVRKVIDDYKAKLIERTEHHMG